MEGESPTLILLWTSCEILVFVAGAHVSRNLSSGLQRIKTEAVAQRCSTKKVFLDNLQNSQENTCVCQSLFFNAILLKKRWHRCFPVNFAKFLRTPFSTEQLRWLLLQKRPLNFRRIEYDFKINTQNWKLWNYTEIFASDLCKLRVPSVCQYHPIIIKHIQHKPHCLCNGRLPICFEKLNETRFIAI